MHLYTYENPVNKKHIQKAIDILEDNGLIAFPTVDSWSVGVKLGSSKALNRLTQFRKDHKEDQPFSVMCSDMSMVSHVVHVEEWMYRILRKALPGPYTFIMRSQKKFLKKLNTKREEVGIRIIESDLVHQLISAYNTPLLTASLPKDADEAEQIRFGYQIEDKFGRQLDLILDLGSEITIRESSVVRLIDGVEVLREGVGDVSFMVNGND
jgi:tRNA threonylcarbamoyl adenosine modification protein (Sua5/YciO/YrdC/YwlC family)